MTGEARDCGCAPGFRRPCVHMVMAVLDEETDHLTLDEIERTEKFIQRMANNPRREELESELPLPYRIKVLGGGAPGTGRR